MRQVFENIGRFVFRTFPKAGSKEHLLKLKQETDEAINTPTLEEYADCLICLFGAIQKDGISFGELIKATNIKLCINEEREWIENSDGTHQHK